VDEQLPAASALATMNEALATVSRGQNALLLPKLPPDLYKSAANRLERALTRMEEARQRFQALPHEESTAKAWADVQQPYESWRRQARGVAEAALEWDRIRVKGPAEAGLAYDHAWDAWMAARHAYAPLEQALANTGKAVAAEASSAREQGHAAVRRAVIVILAVLAAAIAVSIAAGLLLARAIARSIQRLLEETGGLVQAVRAGSLDERGKVASVSHEFRPVVEGMNARWTGRWCKATPRARTGAPPPRTDS
jgi:nitrogen fixation/metabolism regulation signal transduction histidine kinase